MMFVSDIQGYQIIAPELDSWLGSWLGWGHTYNVLQL